MTCPLFRCQLKMHAVSHMEMDGVSTITASVIDVSPLERHELDVASSSSSLSSQLDDVHVELNHTRDTDLPQCPECRLTVEEELRAHFAKGEGRFPCPLCPIVMGNKCSLAAHERIHDRLPPYICPECGEAFR